MEEEVINSEVTEETSPVTETTEQTSETVNEAPVEAPVTETPVEQVTPPVKTYSQEEYDKMVYSFKRQLGRQKDKYESTISNWDKRFGELEKKYNEKFNPPEVKYRDDFENDDKYISYLSKQQVEAALAERDQKMREEFEAYQKQQEEEQAHRKEIDEGIKSWYPTDEERTKWRETVENSMSEGLGDLLTQEKYVLDYLHQTPNQSRILFELATKPELVKQIFSIRNPLMRLLEVRDLENKLIAEKNAVPTTPAPTPSAPVEPVKPTPANNLSKSIGKPGTQMDAKPDITANHDSMINFIRS